MLQVSKKQADIRERVWEKIRQKISSGRGNRDEVQCLCQQSVLTEKKIVRQRQQCLRSSNHAGMFRGSHTELADDMKMYTSATLLCSPLITCVATMATVVLNCCLQGWTASVMTSGWGSVINLLPQWCMCASEHVWIKPDSPTIQYAMKIFTYSLEIQILSMCESISVVQIRRWVRN